MPPELITGIDMWASKNGVSRSEAIRRLIERGLEAENAKGGRH